MFRAHARTTAQHPWTINCRMNALLFTVAASAAASARTKYAPVCAGKTPTSGVPAPETDWFNTAKRGVE